MRPANEIAERVTQAGGKIIDRGDDGMAIELGRLLVIASWGYGWDHVSVSRIDACPTWDEMQQVRGITFTPDEWVVQYSPPESEHIGVHPRCLHMWRPQNETVPIPPSWMVA